MSQAVPSPVALPQHNDMVVVEGIGKQFWTPEGPLVAIEQVSFSVAPGEFLAVIGPSGCGKSTLFSIIGGLLDDYEGKVSIAGERVRGPHPSIGMVFQEESAFPWRTVIDNVAFPLEIAGVARSERASKAEHFVSLVGLDGFEKRYPAELSGGMRQRIRRGGRRGRKSLPGSSSYKPDRPHRFGQCRRTVVAYDRSRGRPGTT
jgi:NitT/TauT family transport system ATP-binding protein